MDIPGDVIGRVGASDVTWRPDPRPDAADREAARIRVPMDYSCPEITIELAVSRIPARGAARGCLVALNGGPGGDSGQGKDVIHVLEAQGLADSYDLIGFDPRGFGDSTFLAAEVTPVRATFDSRPSDEVFETIASDMRAREDGCARRGGDFRRHVTTRNTARDIDVIRHALGYEQISFVGYAYGTAVGAAYGEMFPGRLDRTVLDSCVHPGWRWEEQFLYQVDTIKRNVNTWAGWEAEVSGGFGADVRGVRGSVEEVAEGLVKLSGTAARSSFDALVGTMAASRPEWGSLSEVVRTLSQALAAKDADQAGTILRRATRWRASDAEGAVRCGVLDAVTLEHPWSREVEGYFGRMRTVRDQCPYGLAIVRAYPWVGTFTAMTPTEEATKISRRDRETGLVIQADSDVMDHRDGGAEMADRLGYRLVRVQDSGEHEIFGMTGNATVDAIVLDYLLRGTLPAENTDCPGPPRPQR
ncbi:alpha/beta fold hydrolase [Enemella evansiae]|uniref:alpha/beta fold hydrolase n=1 Tax=Enemella evansiae TaxID=2016499 RepID=UPI001E33374E|nr:alpha/beta fold hydrolase [Enemella evansiae]